MREKELFLFNQKDFREIAIQILNIFVMSMVLYVLIIQRTPVWIIAPVILAIITVAVMLSITIMNSSFRKRNTSSVKLRCYRWDFYKEGTNAYRIYADNFIYVELIADKLGYERFRERYNTEKKIKRLVYRHFRSFIVFE